MAKIDDIDKQILAFLHEDAFMSNKEMASRLGLSATPVHERI
jgi:DNA-binding Lrp family transcriptional regulator